MELELKPTAETPNQPIEKSEEQIAFELFSQNLEKKLVILNEARMKNSPKTLMDDVKLLEDSNLDKKELIHLLAITTKRMSNVAGQLEKIIQSI